jgi:hypothetical protein
MKESDKSQICRLGCSAPVPQELGVENLCAQHFMLAVEQACGDMRREAAMERASTARRFEIERYVKTTAVKLSEVAMGSRLSDDLKKRVLTTFLTLMNLQESVERSTTRFVQIRPPQRALSVIPEPATLGRLA